MNGKKAKRLRREARESGREEMGHGVRTFKRPTNRGASEEKRVELHPGGLRALYRYLKGQRSTPGE